ncbi:DeoR family transcriptional regulator [Alteribacillus sp. HJP-4]|uniref:DeoR family transcriptional regulator n=1 Tax=Alteribacillus sp. HJP-4 TaxID=2775394 RepID=UPI0035CCEB98
MLPIERQQQILTWLEHEETMRVSDISKRLDVSEMTIYRDIKPLIEQEKILKTGNGISLVPQTFVSSNHCSYCHKPSNSRLSVKLLKVNQQVELACCAHCGLLRYQDIKKDISQIICQDFLTDTTISAKMAVYLIHADVNLNCCQPQVISFQSMKQAEQFQLGFGGDIYHFDDAIRTITKEMHGDSCCQSNNT